jgi:hypothetical protein
MILAPINGVIKTSMDGSAYLSYYPNGQLPSRRRSRNIAVSGIPLAELEASYRTLTKPGPSSSGKSG